MWYVVIKAFFITLYLRNSNPQSLFRAIWLAEVIKFYTSINSMSMNLGTIFFRPAPYMNNVDKNKISIMSWNYLIRNELLFCWCNRCVNSGESRPYCKSPKNKIHTCNIIGVITLDLDERYNAVLAFQFFVMKHQGLCLKRNRNYTQHNWPCINEPIEWICKITNVSICLWECIFRTHCL